MTSDGPISDVRAHAGEIPTGRPEPDRTEPDGTPAWYSTTVVVAEADGGGHTGTGWTYGHTSLADLVRGPLAAAVTGTAP
ncbi:hypothetical protein [Streptomyces beihaiensis]|uniref:Uncharacterized protein n=1 Tax=Streptomyces beihaiensis TaxID=2984495 RepID=A0ABT3TXG5_9ACTN|nr:hypothetical protein [Streptomyces beihaiensis]MCX3061736.1 hypothetical protein [Streptomyces beihaiensis]